MDRFPISSPDVMSESASQKSPISPSQNADMPHALSLESQLSKLEK